MHVECAESHHSNKGGNTCFSVCVGVYYLLIENLLQLVHIQAELQLRFFHIIPMEHFCLLAHSTSKHRGHTYNYVHVWSRASSPLTEVLHKASEICTRIQTKESMYGSVIPEMVASSIALQGACDRHWNPPFIYEQSFDCVGPCRCPVMRALSSRVPSQTDLRPAMRDERKGESLCVTQRVTKEIEGLGELMRKNKECFQDTTGNRLAKADITAAIHYDFIFAFFLSFKVRGTTAPFAYM